jgi:hypothetical protein
MGEWRSFYTQLSLVLENPGHTLSTPRLDSLHQLVCKVTYHFTDKLELCEVLMIVIQDSEKHCKITK